MKTFPKDLPDRFLETRQSIPHAREASPSAQAMHLTVDGRLLYFATAGIILASITFPHARQNV